MSLLRPHFVRVNVVLGGLLLGLMTLTGCEEDGKTAPERCLEPALPIFDIQAAGAPSDDNARFDDDAPLPPCITKVGHAISSNGGGTATAGTSSGGTSSGGNAGSGGTTTAEAGAGGAGGAP